MTRSIWTRLVLGVALLTTPAVFMGCSEENKPVDTAPGGEAVPAPGAPGEAPGAPAAPGAPGEAPGAAPAPAPAK